MNYLERLNNKIEITDPFPLIIYNDFLKDSENDEIYSAIKSNEEFDTEKFGGRKQLRMGSKNFQNLLEKNICLNKLSKFLNNENTFKYLLNEINNLPNKKKYVFEMNNDMSYDANPDVSFFTKKNSLKNKIIYNLKNLFSNDKNKISLQIDFSLSKKGYTREPHTDKPTRILVMLIYFNNLTKEDGGTLDIYKYRLKKEKYTSHPSESEIEKKHSFIPKSKSLIIFQSNPESVHSVSEMLTDKERVFAYGAYTMKYPVNW